MNDTHLGDVPCYVQETATMYIGVGHGGTRTSLVVMFKLDHNVCYELVSDFVNEPFYSF